MEHADVDTTRVAPSMAGMPSLAMARGRSCPCIVRRETRTAEDRDASAKIELRSQSRHPYPAKRQPARQRRRTVRSGLVERAQRGDANAFDALVDLDIDRCLGIASRIIRDRGLAEDAVQQAFILAWRELPRLRDVERYDVWLHRLVVTACYQELRRLRRWRDRIVPLTLDGTGPSPDAIRAADDREALDRAFARLSPDRRAIFVLHHHAGLSIAEVAEIVGLPIGTVKSRLHYSVDTLRAALAADARVQETEARA
jgi:RNA polymerase sigma-70 factor (ECF subfamily)